MSGSTIPRVSMGGGRSPQKIQMERERPVSILIKEVYVGRKEKDDMLREKCREMEKIDGCVLDEVACFGVLMSSTKHPQSLVVLKYHPSTGSTLEDGYKHR